MGFLERAIRRGVGDAVGKAIGNAVKDVVEPRATALANKAAKQFDDAAAVTAEQSRSVSQSVNQSASGLEGALGNLQRSMESYATEAAKNIKTCPSCGESTTAEKKFCPSCGARLPEESLAQGAVCQACGKQNTIGTKFCQDCGAKLPAALKEEQASMERSQAALSQWDTLLAGYPKWNCGGRELQLDSYAADGYCTFQAEFDTRYAADRAIDQYRYILRQNGFTGDADNQHLRKWMGGVTLHVDTEHIHDGDANCPTIFFVNER